MTKRTRRSKRQEKTQPTKGSNIGEYLHKINLLGWVQIILVWGLAAAIAVALDPKGEIWLKSLIGLLPALILFLTKLWKDVAAGKQLFGMLVTLALIGAILGVTFGFAIPRYEQSKSFCSTIDPEIKPADVSKKELLVLISEFDRSRDSVNSLYPDDNLFAALNIAAMSINQQSDDFFVRIEKLRFPVVLTESKSDQIADCLNPTIIIWGNVRQIDTWYTLNYYPNLGGRPDQTSIKTSEVVDKDEFILQGSLGEFVLSWTLARLYDSLGKPTDSLDYLNKTVQFVLDHPELPDTFLYSAYGARSLVLIKLGDYEAALNDTLKAVEILPTIPILNSLAVIYIKTNQLDLALNTLNNVLIMYPNEPSPIIYYNRGVVYDRMGFADLAEADFKTAKNLEH